MSALDAGLLFPPEPNYCADSLYDDHAERLAARDRPATLEHRTGCRCTDCGRDEVAGDSRPAVRAVADPWMWGAA